MMLVDRRLTVDLTDLKLLHQQGYTEVDGVVIEASPGCADLLAEASERGVRL